MSEFSEFHEYIVRYVKDGGHFVGGFHWAPIMGTPTHEARCKICGGCIQIFWDADERMWFADGDLIQGCADVIACDWWATNSATGESLTDEIPTPT